MRAALLTQTKRVQPSETWRDTCAEKKFKEAGCSPVHGQKDEITRAQGMTVNKNRSFL